MSYLPWRACATLACALTVLTAPLPSTAAAVTIEYSLTSLAAPNRYQYSYTVTNVSLATPVTWFSVDFDAALYDEGSLLITSTGLGDWSEALLGAIVIPPSFNVPAQYDAYNVGGTPLGIGDSESGFTVEFTWLGSGTPGGQFFTVYDPGNLDVLDSGQTTPADVDPPVIPEPSSLALVLLALAGTAALGRRSPGPSAPRPGAGAGFGAITPIARAA